MRGGGRGRGKTRPDPETGASWEGSTVVGRVRSGSGETGATWVVVVAGLGAWTATATAAASKEATVPAPNLELGLWTSTPQTPHHKQTLPWFRDRTSSRSHSDGHPPPGPFPFDNLHNLFINGLSTTVDLDIFVQVVRLSPQSMSSLLRSSPTVPDTTPHGPEQKVSSL